MAKITVYFSERRMEDRELWHYIQENTTGDTSDFIKHLVKIGIMAVQAGRVGTGLAVGPSDVTVRRLERKKGGSRRELSSAGSQDVVELSNDSFRNVAAVPDNASSAAGTLLNGGVHTVVERLNDGLQDVQEQTKNRQYDAQEPLDGDSCAVNAQSKNDSDTVDALPNDRQNNDNALLNNRQDSDNTLPKKPGDPQDERDLVFEITEDNGTPKEDPFFQLETDPEILEIFRKQLKEQGGM